MKQIQLTLSQCLTIHTLTTETNSAAKENLKDLTFIRARGSPIPPFEGCSSKPEGELIMGSNELRAGNL